MAPSLWAALCVLSCLPLGAAGLEGVLFEDLDQDGIHDPGEPAVEGAWVRVAGRSDGGGLVSDQVQTGPGGSYAFALPEGCCFRERCDRAFDACVEAPPLVEDESGRQKRCFLEEAP